MGGVNMILHLSVSKTDDNVLCGGNYMLLLFSVDVCPTLLFLTTQLFLIVKCSDSI